MFFGELIVVRWEELMEMYRFWFPMSVSIVLIAGMIVCATSLVPLQWRVDGSGWSVIFPVSWVSSIYVCLSTSDWLIVVFSSGYWLDAISCSRYAYIHRAVLFLTTHDDVHRSYWTHGWWCSPISFWIASRAGSLLCGFPLRPSFTKSNFSRSFSWMLAIPRWPRRGFVTYRLTNKRSLRTPQHSAPHLLSYQDPRLTVHLGSKTLPFWMLFNQYV